MANKSTAVLPKRPIGAGKKLPNIRVSPLVLEIAALDTAQVYARLNTRAEGLSAEEAEARLAKYGPNILAKDQRPGFGKLLWRALRNPLVILLAVLATISFATGDVRAGVMMVSMIVLSVGLKLVQETKATNAAAKAQVDDLGNGHRVARRRASGNPCRTVGAGRCGAAGRGRHDPRRRADRPSQGSIRNPGGAHRRELPGGKHASFARNAARAPALGDCAGYHSVPWHQRRKRYGHCHGRRDGRQHLPRQHGRVAAGAADGDGVRSRHLQFHLADAALHGWSWCRWSSSSMA